MAANNKKLVFRMLFLIAAPKLVNKAVDLLKEENVPMQYVFHAQGTASSEVMDMLGLDGIDKNILMCMLPKVFADEMLRRLKKSLHLGMPNTGIAYTVTMSGGSGGLLQLMETLQPSEEQKRVRRDGNDMADIAYYMVMAIVNQGFSGEVMEAARPVGASGGTVFHSRHVGTEESMKFWKISVQEEREVVIILARKEDKLSIMKAIAEKCGLQSDANGIVMSLPVDGIVGLD